MGDEPAGKVRRRCDKAFRLVETDLPRLSGRSKIAEAIRYAISWRAPLQRFLSDGRAKIDSTHCSQDPLAAVGPGQLSPRFCKPQK